ncbi:beta-galactosidase [Gracilibacillus caseinilyticus]|uniref:Beta-galactosidase n=1 Tax=Gracilibacillus caseinilyticus TaxID=2932256 RepID=A0ABY4F0G4_9BACI|nr:beta-galactosidase [Gracilibacillus caseinilyticus]UOQ50151.1 beta-galactosidase [Gracilibacillus caseinilyticus]
MRTYPLDITTEAKEIYPALTNFHQQNKNGDTISFTNYYMEWNHQPFFGISGEFHFSRYHEHFWEDELIKMKMNGINIISTYIFWNHHEETEGTFEWDGDKNVRKFIELCAKHQLLVNIRIGPFNHGEARNGGIPDWLFGRPFTLRSNDKEYLYYVKRLYQQIGKQVAGLLFKEGGPIISTQLENEFQHAGAPWELTTGTSNEWLQAGMDGEAHIKKLKALAIETGIDTPIYSATGWGGAIAPMDTVLPLWGGYAYWPWIFYGDVEKHPATPSFIFRDYHNNQVPETFDFEPAYQPESVPYACAEMGGGMTVFYYYRFQLPYQSVDALSAIKVAGGCNFVGYYVFHGGSNPKGKHTPFLNETVTPKISYDYQAPIGEFGQVRGSYHRLKRQHLFYQQYGESFARTRTILPQEEIQPEDIDTVRYAVRTDGKSGYVYINNFQDHLETKDQKDFTIELQLDDELVRFPSLTLARDENCILPFHFDLDGVNLRYATNQLITETSYQGETYYFFFTPKGMRSEYVLDVGGILDIRTEVGTIEQNGKDIVVSLPQQLTQLDLTTKEGNIFHICTLTHEQSMQFWKVDDRILLTKANVLADESGLRLESEGADSIDLATFPPLAEKQTIFTEYKIPFMNEEMGFDVDYRSDDKAVITFAPTAFANVKELLLKIDYEGDIGYAFIDGELIHDHFANQDTWEIGLKRFEKKLLEKGMYLYITPIKEGVAVKSDSSMAARKEVAEKVTAAIASIKVVPIYEVDIK